MAACPPGGTTSRAVGRPRGFRKKGTEACRGVFTYLCPLWQDKLFEHYPLWTFSQAEAGRMLTRTPLLSWMGGYEEASFTPHEHPSQFLLASNFYNSRDVTVGWFDSKIVIFLLQKCLGQNQLLTESLPQNGTGSPWGRGAGCSPLPVPASPTCLSVLGLPTSQEATLQRQPAAAPTPRPVLPCRVHVGRCGFFSFSSRNSRLTICHD